MNKLRSFNIDGDLLLWFEDYLRNRKQRVAIDGVYSSWRDVLAGVPQGSILGPLLFLIFVNDIVDNIVTIIRLFADDTSLAHSSLDLAADINIQQADLNNILHWADEWCVKFNHDKTECLFISRRVNKNPVHLTFDTNPVPIVHFHKHPGVPNTP